jgi:hypothetical protein
VEENKTSEGDTKQGISMDSKYTRENNIDGSGDWGSITLYQVPPTGSNKIVTGDTSELGNELQVVLYQPSRIRLVERVSRNKEWSTDPEGTSSNSKNTNIPHCVKMVELLRRAYDEGFHDKNKDDDDYY